MERIHSIQELFIQHGIIQSRFTYEVLFDSEKYPLWGSNYNIYPGKEDCLYHEKCELGIVIEQID